MKKNIYTLWLAVAAILFSAGTASAQSDWTSMTPGSPVTGATYDPVEKVVTITATAPFMDASWQYLPDEARIDIRVFRFKDDAGTDKVLVGEEKGLAPGKEVIIVDQIEMTTEDEVNGKPINYEITAAIGENECPYPSQARALCITKPAAPYVNNAKYNFADKAITMTIELPTGFSTGVVFPEDTKLSLEIFRSSAEEEEKSLKVEENLAPGAKFEFADADNLTEQTSYNYSAVVTYKNTFISDKGSTYGGVLCGIKPEKPALMGVPSAGGKAPVNITVTAPTTDSFGDNIPESMLLTITLRRHQGWGSPKIDLKQWTDVKPGEILTFADSDETLEENASYSYEATSAIGSIECSYPQSIYVLLGLDSPAMLEKVTATPEGDAVKITWTPVSETGANGGYVDPESVIYRVYRCSDDGPEEITPEEGTKATEWSDNSISLEKQKEISYQVIPENETGKLSAGRSSDKLILGPAPKMPYTETFPCVDWNAPYDNIWTTSSNWRAEKYLSWYNDVAGKSFYINGYDYNEDTNPEDGALGIPLSTYSATGKDLTVTSGAIDMSETESPLVTFYYYNIPVSKSQLDLQVSTDGVNFKTIASIAHNADELENKTEKEQTEGWWEKVSTPAPELAGCAKVTLRFSIPGSNNYEGWYTMFVDHIEVTENTSVSIDEINTESEIENVTYYNLTGVKTANPAAGTIVIKMTRYTDGTVKTVKEVVK